MRGELILSKPIFSIKKISKRIGDVRDCIDLRQFNPSKLNCAAIPPGYRSQTREQMEATQIRAERRVKAVIPSIAEDQSGEM